MTAKVVAFRELQIEGKRYTYDVVIEGGQIRRRRRGASKPLRDQFGHTLLSVAEDIPWGGKRLIVGTGADGARPITPEVSEEAERRGIVMRAASRPISSLGNRPASSANRQKSSLSRKCATA